MTRWILTVAGCLIVLTVGPADRAHAAFGPARLVGGPGDWVRSEVAGVAIDSRGDAVVVWVHGRYGSQVVRSAIRGRDGRWGSATTISRGACSYDDDPLIRVAMDARGDAVAAFDGCAGHVLVVSRRAGHGWGAPHVIAPAGEVVGVAMLGGGGAVVGIRGPASQLHMWTRHGTTWTSRPVLELDASGDEPDELVLDIRSNGRAAALWNTVSDAYLSTWTPSGGWTRVADVPLRYPVDDFRHGANPAVAVAPDGHVVAITEGECDCEAFVRSQIVEYRPDTGFLAPARFARRAFAVAMNDRGDLAVLSLGGGERYTTIWAETLRAGARRFRSQRLGVLGDTLAWYEDVAITTAGRLFATWNSSAPALSVFMDGLGAFRGHVYAASGSLTGGWTRRVPLSGWSYLATRAHVAAAGKRAIAGWGDGAPKVSIAG